MISVGRSAASCWWSFVMLAETERKIKDSATDDVSSASVE